MDKQGTVFVKVEDYKDILEIISLARQRLARSKDALDKITAIKERENQQLDAWQNELAEIEKQLGDIEQKIAETEG